ncbi:endolytic transglycosylase MltG [Allohahella marinimesophila]|uniref:Endolytic murein transglycosylase n=1 Tax=Allohahella marinimesophila TaxID=1054972 RepID=A0ABP7NPU4_9GAMM
MLKRLLRISALLMLLALVAAGAAWYWLQSALEENGPAREPVELEVKQGSSLRAVAGTLADAGVIEHDWLMYYWGRYKSYDRGIKAGEYRFEPGMVLEDVFALLRSGSNVQYLFTIVEGWRTSEMLAALALHDRIEHTLSAQSAVELAQELDFPEANAEGLFLPETYSYRRGETDRSLLVRANQALRLVLDQRWENRAPDLPLKTPYEALILASLIEKETGVVEERERIAGVFTTRLKKGMRLQTDPTVIYGIGETYDGNITRKHLQTMSPYNTYLIRGLPPTPIALPGAAAISAATQPDETGELFFVARGDGSHKFSKTYAEHNKAVKEFQLQRRDDYRSAPAPRVEN